MDPTEITEPFLCKNAISKLPFNKFIATYCNKHKMNVDMPFLQFCKEHASSLKEIQQRARIRWIIVKKYSNTQKTKLYSLIYDGRFFNFVEDHWKFQMWILNVDGQLLQKLKKQHRNFKLRPLNKVVDQKPLWQLLSLDQEMPDPQSPAQLQSFLRRCNRNHNVLVEFNYKPPNCFDTWNSTDYSQKSLLIDAFTTSNYSIAYKKRVTGTPKVKPMLQDKLPQAPISKIQQNKSSCVTVKLSGLNAAFNLGLIDLPKLTFFSQQLAFTVGILHLELDDENNARYATFTGAKSCFQIELKTEKAWTKLFQCIMKEKKAMEEKKASLLQPVIDQLIPFKSKLNNPFKKCLISLQNCIKNYKIILYDSLDFSLHALKLHLAHYLNTHQKKYYLSLNLNAMNDITCIRNSDLTIFNLYSYLEDEIFFKNHLDPAKISSKILDFNHQKKQDSGLTVHNHCKQRGQSITRHVLKLYQDMAQEFVQLFMFDMCSLPYVSLASLSFQVLWMQYTRKGGHFHQGIEKIKPHHEKILRQYCQGGYYYSCKSKLDANEPIHNTFGNPAASLLEYDVISSYGYSSSHISAPTGFCYGYILNENNDLVRCDKLLRHTTFEFLSVFYTIDMLVTRGCQIQTCYSNYHQTGIFSIGNYPLDLAIVFQDGTVQLYQFDGQVCYTCKAKK